MTLQVRPVSAALSHAHTEPGHHAWASQSPRLRPSPTTTSCLPSENHTPHGAQIPLSKEETEDVFLDLTRKFGFQTESMRNMVSAFPLSRTKLRLATSAVVSLPCNFPSPIILLVHIGVECGWNIMRPAHTRFFVVLWTLGRLVDRVCLSPRM